MSSYDCLYKTVNKDFEGTRLDYWLKKNFPKASFPLFCKLIRKGAIRVNGRRIKNSYKLSIEDKLKIPSVLIKENLREKKINHSASIKNDVLSWVIYKDSNIIVLNKPSGIAVQGGTKIKFNIDILLDILRFDYAEKPKLVHRIDRETSGLLIIARTLESAKFMTKIFRERKVIKNYIAIVTGVPKKKFGIINKKIFFNKIFFDAKTYYKVLDYNTKNSVLILMPITGRKHQIRKHLQQINIPIIGDKKYGIQSDNYFKFSLHAFSLSFKDINGEKFFLKSKIPSVILRNLKELNLKIESISENTFSEIDNWPIINDL